MPAARSRARQPVGAAHARRAPGDRAVRGRLAVARQSTPATSSCSTSSSTARGAGPTRSTTRAPRHHVSFADPYCPVVAPARGRSGRARRRARCTTAARSWWSRARGSRPAPSRAGSASEGWDVVNMTQYPEAYLARELGMHYAGIALVTDYDTGVEHDPGVAAGHPGPGVRVLRGEPAPDARAAARPDPAASGRADRLRLRRRAGRWTVRA